MKTRIKHWPEPRPLVIYRAWLMRGISWLPWFAYKRAEADRT